MMATPKPSSAATRPPSSMRCPVRGAGDEVVLQRPAVAACSDTHLVVAPVVSGAASWR